MIHLKRLCNYLKQFQTIYRSGEVNKHGKTEGNKQCNKRNTKFHKSISFFSVLKVGVDIVFGCPCGKHRWLEGLENGIGTTCIRFSTLLSSVAHTV